MSYFDLLDTSGEGDGGGGGGGGGGYETEEAIDDAVAEGVAAMIMQEAEEAATDTSGFLDTGALSFGLDALLQAPQKLIQGMLGMGIPVAKARKIVPKVKAKVKTKVATKKAAAPRAPARPPAAPARPAVPQLGPLNFGAMVPRPQGPPPAQAFDGHRPKLLGFSDLMDRVMIRQLANYSGTITAGASTDIQVKVTRNGWVLNWSNSDAADPIIVRRVSYGQDTTTVFNDQTLGAWSSKALNRVPIDPIEVQMPNVFDAELENPTDGDIRVVWTMWGLSQQDAATALRDPDVAYTLAHKGVQAALVFAVGQGWM